MLSYLHEAININIIISKKIVILSGGKYILSPGVVVRIQNEGGRRRSRIPWHKRPV